MLNKLAHKSFSYRYAEVLLKGDKNEKVKKNDKNKSCTWKIFSHKTSSF